MSELKSHDLVDIQDYRGEVYLKSEADKVIAELEDELQAANEQIENLINSASSIMLFQDRVNDNKCAEFRHHKYKRCLAMAKLCNEKWLVHNFAEIPTKLGFYDRWEKRWLELAEKFKEAK